VDDKKTRICRLAVLVLIQMMLVSVISKLSLQKYLFILKTENDLYYFFGAIPKIWSTIVLTTYIFITLHQNLINSCSMVIDFDDIKECRTMNFKGGKGPLDSRSFSDDDVKIMYSTLRPGSSTGLHTHNGNSEVIYIISGEATFHYDDTTEVVRVGQCHYCPEGHSHYMENLTDHDLVYLAIVPQHNK